MVIPQADPVEPLANFINGILLELGALSQVSGSQSATDDQSQQGLPLTARPYVLTLHVLYPHATLDALDLLDRGLVTRLLASTQPPTPETAGNANANATLRREIIDEMDADDEARAEQGAADAEGTQTAPRAENESESTPHQSRPIPRVMYSVRSAQVPHHRQSMSTAESATESNLRSYQVSLRAWHCTCPAFALAAFQPAEEQSLPPDTLEALRPETPGELRPGAMKTDAEHTGQLPEGLRLGFGGLPASRLEREGTGNVELPPICKHLMACVLAEAAPVLFASRDRHEAEDGSRTLGAQGMSGVVQRWVNAEEAAGWAVGAGHS